jgi:uroporphyrinogen-III synthase
VLVSSGEALANVLDGLSAPARAHLLASTAVASSERLAQAARGAGFAATLLAASPTTDELLDALAAHAKAGAIR